MFVYFSVFLGFFSYRLYDTEVPEVIFFEFFWAILDAEDLQGLDVLSR